MKKFKMGGVLLLTLCVAVFFSCKKQIDLPAQTNNKPNQEAFTENTFGAIPYQQGDLILGNPKAKPLNSKQYVNCIYKSCK